MKVFVKKTKTILDDLVIQALTPPIFIFLVTVGLWIGFTRLPELAAYIDHRGTITVDASRWGGAEFCIEFPVAGAKPKTQNPKS